MPLTRVLRYNRVMEMGRRGISNMMSFGALIRTLDMLDRIAQTRQVALLHCYVVDQSMTMASALRGYLICGTDPASCEVLVARDVDGQPIAMPERLVRWDVLRQAFAEQRALSVAQAPAYAEPLCTDPSAEFRHITICAPLLDAGAPVGALYLELRYMAPQHPEEAVLMLSFFAENLLGVMRTHGLLALPTTGPTEPLRARHYPNGRN